MSTKMVDKIAKLLNQAERADEGSPEREAFLERAMQLSQAYSIDLAVARAKTVQKERVEQPERRSFKVGDTGPRKRGANAYFVDLMIAICDANDINVTIGGSNVYVHGYGMPSDLDMAERYFALLSLQMVQEADAGLKRGEHGEVTLLPKYRTEEIPEDDRAWGQHDGSDGWTQRSYYDDRNEELVEGPKGPLRWRDVENYVTGSYRTELVRSYPPPKTRKVAVLDDEGNPVMEERFAVQTDARIWRANFYQGFINRTRYRLRDARNQALKDAGIEVTDTSDSRAMALRDKAKEVQDFYEEEAKHVLATGRTYDGASTSRYDYGGQSAGDEAGQRATLGNERDLPSS